MGCGFQAYQPIHSRVRQARPAKGAISAITTNINVKGCLVTEGLGAMSRSSLLEDSSGKCCAQRRHGDMVASDPGRLARRLEPDAGTGVFPDVTGEAATSAGTV